MYYIYIHIYSYIYIYIYIQVFLTGGQISSFNPTWKISLTPTKSLTKIQSHPPPPLTTKYKFSSHNSIKTSFLAAVTLVPFLF